MHYSNSLIRSIFNLFFISLIFFSCDKKDDKFELESPNKEIKLSFHVNESGIPFYKVYVKDALVLRESRLGVDMENASFSSQLSVVEASVVKSLNDSYKMIQGKRTDISYKANERIFQLENENGLTLGVQFRVSNDGVGFRYLFKNKTNEKQVVEEELTDFHFADSATMFVQPMSAPKTGWESTNPSYEEPYQQGISIATASPLNSGWVYPALFNTGDDWLLITEAGLDANYCGSRLRSVPNSSKMKLDFPSDAEAFTGKGSLPHSKTDWHSPWRVITIGDLATLVESTLGTDLADPAIDLDKTFVKPGYASWSWAVLKDSSVNFETTMQFIDYAADMNWEYCLVDADWDRRIGLEKIKELVRYGEQKGVGILLWYNSAGDWNTTPYTPKSKLLTHEQREKEFSMLQEIGVKGIKVDFFGGDGQSMIAYYHDMMKDAANHKLLLNFHGATLPRGWHRTYPNLMTVEAVKGFEFITFTQDVADVEANHAAMLPFTRNVFDPMDFTPMVFSNIPNIERKTTNGFELALPTLFHSGIQHMAEIPEGMAEVPGFVKDYLSQLPPQWDETKFIAGYPGKLAVLARRSGENWYITGINGENKEKKLELDLSFLAEYEGYLIGDGEEDSGFMKKEVNISEQPYSITIKGNGGFIMKFFR